MEEAFEVASQNARKNAHKGKQHYDAKGYGTAVLNIGIVFLFETYFRKVDLANCVLTGSRTSMSLRIVLLVIYLYTMFREQMGREKIRRLLRNLLLLCNSLPLPDVPTKVVERRKRSTKPTTQHIKADSDTSSDAEVYLSMPVSKLNPEAEEFRPTTSSDSSVQEVPPPVLPPEEVVVVSRSSSGFQSAQEDSDADDESGDFSSTDDSVSVQGERTLSPAVLNSESETSACETRLQPRTRRPPRTLTYLHYSW